MVCKKCGKLIRDDQKFCGWCGEKVTMDTFAVQEKSNSVEMQNIGIAPQSDSNTKPSAKRRTKKIIILAASIVSAVLLCVLIIIGINAARYDTHGCGDYQFSTLSEYPCSYTGWGEGTYDWIYEYTDIHDSNDDVTVEVFKYNEEGLESYIEKYYSGCDLKGPSYMDYYRDYDVSAGIVEVSYLAVDTENGYAMEITYSSSYNKYENEIVDILKSFHRD